MTKYILTVLFVACSSSVFAKSDVAPTTGFVQIRKGQELYVEHYPAAPGKPTIFLANGLTYSTKQYDDYVRALRELDPGVGIVAYDMQGMGRTLLKYAPWKGPLPIEQQVKDLRDLLKALKISGPKALMGLSYGGALELLYATMYPDDFAHFIGFAPLVERIPDQDMLLRAMVTNHKFRFPLDPRSDDEIYDLYLRGWIYMNYPVAEPIIWENPYKIEAIYRMVAGVKNFNAFTHAENDEFPAKKMHVIAAKQDEHVKLGRMDAFWNALPESARGSFLRLDHSTHKIPEVWPKVSAAWTLHIVNGNSDLQRGLIFEGDPYKHEAKSGAIRIPLNKVDNCELILGTVSEPSAR